MWTTSRYAPKSIRNLAIALSGVFCGCYVSRGKKGISELAESARREGEERIFIVNGKKTIEIAEIDELGRWNWVDERVGINEEQG